MPERGRTTQRRSFQISPYCHKPFKYGSVLAQITVTIEIQYKGTTRHRKEYDGPSAAMPSGLQLLYSKMGKNAQM